MKALLLLRHAKASNDDNSLSDFDRPLNERGIRDAPLIGNFIRKKKVHPDLVISSPAKRAEQTTRLVLNAADLEVEPRFDERIYEASVHRLLEVLSQIEDSANEVMLVGHNPGFGDLFECLTGEATNLSTASLAGIELQLEKWREVRAGVGDLKWLVTPKKLARD